MVAFTVHHSGASFGGQVLKNIAQRFDECVAQSVAFGGAAQAHHGNCAVHLQRNAVAAGSFNRWVKGGGHVRLSVKQ
jgi:homoserine acetyltransferase